MPEPREAILSLGSNQGDRLAELDRACASLDIWPGILLLARSPVYETEPVGVPPAFSGHLYLNRVVIVNTTLAPAAFSDAIHTIEERLGRVRGATPGLPRIIDIDIITFGNLRLDTPELTLPHPRARTRRFVLQLLADLRPEFVFPGDTQSVSDLLHALPPTPRVTRHHASGQS